MAPPKSESTFGGPKSESEKKSKPRLFNRNTSGNQNSSSSNDSNGTPTGSNNSPPVAPPPRPKEPTEDDLRRYQGYVGQQWTGVCKWFNVSKGFGFVIPDFEEAKEDDVFVHQSSLQMPGFRSLGEGETIQFTVRLGRRGLEAENVTGIEGAPIQGHTIHPMGNRHGERKIRCYNCGQLGKHKADRCRKVLVSDHEQSGKVTKVCYHCHQADHLLAQCPLYNAQKNRKPKGNNRGGRRADSGGGNSGVRGDSKTVRKHVANNQSDTSVGGIA